MKLFSIDADNTITTFAAAEQIPEGQERFSSEEELFAASTTWPADRMAAIWNSFAGVAGFGADLKPVKKFTDRTVACKRIWNAIQKLDGVEAAAPAPEAPAPAATKSAKTKAKKPAAKPARKAANVAPAKAKATKTTKPAKKAAAATSREGSKKQVVIDMMKRKGGATLAEIMAETGWQKHTIRGLVSILQSKGGLTIESTKSDAGDRTYRIAK